MRSLHSVLPVVLALALAAGIGRAEEPEDHWEKGDPRPFLAAELDLGTAEHVSVAVGYGKPHLMWGGLIAHGFATLDFAAARFGARVDLQALSLEGGLRLQRSWKHLPLPDVAVHTEIPKADGFASQALDLSASGGFPLGPGFAIFELVGVRSLSDLGDVQLYDELFRVVYRPPWLVAASAGWVASLRGGALLLGGRAQWAVRTGRSGDPFVRLGPVAFWRLWPHLALAGDLLYPVSNPDRMSFADPIEAFLVLSFTAATGDRPPRFP